MTPQLTRDWMDHGTQLLLDAVDRLHDAAFDSATGLPGWTRRHVIAHVHFNAEALRRLVSWAHTGRPCAMYEGPDQRNAEIEAGAKLTATELRELVRSSAKALAADLDALPETSWTNEVVTAQGRTVPAVKIPWLRTREVTIHAIDLDVGSDFDDIPAPLLRALINDVITRRITTGEGPTLARWLTGRATRAPELGSWL